MVRPDSTGTDPLWTKRTGAPRWVLVLAALVPLAFGGIIVATLIGSGLGTAAPAGPRVASSVSPSADPATSAAPSVAGEPATVVFVGDSSTAGVGASTAAARWTSVLSARRGWTEVNLGAPGTGYRTSLDDPAGTVCGAVHCPNFSEVIPAVVAANPDIVIVSGGREDIRTDLARIDAVREGLATTRAVRDTVTAFRAALPGTPIYFVAPYWDDDPAPAELTTVRESVRSAAEDNEATYIDLGQPLLGRTDLVAADGVNPNDAGAVAIADAVGGWISVP